MVGPELAWRPLVIGGMHRSGSSLTASLLARAGLAVGDRLFVADPVFALHVWQGYNRLIVDFMRAHPARCLLVEIGQVIDDPAAVFAAVESRFDLPLGDVRPLYREEHFVRGARGAEAALVRAVLPEACELYMEMRRIAGSTAALPVAVRIHGADGDAEEDVRVWARRSRAAALVRPRSAAA